jgi:hypothetical protein
MEGSVLPPPSSQYDYRTIYRKSFCKTAMESKINSYFESNNPEALKNNFTDKIGTTAVNSLNLSKIYIHKKAASK